MENSLQSSAYIQSESVIDYSDPWLYQDHGDLPPLLDGKDTFTPEELLELILKDIQQIYDADDAV